VLRAQARRFHRLLLSLDLGVSAALFSALLIWQFGPPRAFGAPPLDAPYLLLAATATVSWSLTLVHLGLYASQRRSPLWEVATRLIVAGLVCAVALSAANLALGGPLPAELPARFAVGQFAALTALRLIAFSGLRLLRRRGRNFRSVIVIGSGPRAYGVTEVIAQHPEWGLRVVGFVDEVSTPVDPRVPLESLFKMIDMPDILRERVIDEAIIACPRSMLDRVAAVVEVCALAGIPVTLLGDLFGFSLPPPRVTHLDSLVALSFAPVHHSAAKLLVKRVMDISGASIGLLLSAPVIGVAALAIRITSPGEVFFRQERCGLNGRRFFMYKLRTMCVDAEDLLDELQHANELDGPVFKIRNDPRITRVGAFLRRYSLDELPQFWNVLKGDMSLVGPRPPVPREVHQYELFDRRRLSMRPGLSGLWQVSGRNGIGFEDWVKLDLQYIDSWSLGLDVRIMLLTLPAVLTGEGAS
jgi:exopolysaccharide biosynthesis polyprenyl glycosylphosphotransferase